MHCCTRPLYLALDTEWPCPCQGVGRSFNTCNNTSTNTGTFPANTREGQAPAPTLVPALRQHQRQHYQQRCAGANTSANTLPVPFNASTHTSTNTSINASDGTNASTNASRNTSTNSAPAPTTTPARVPAPTPAQLESFSHLHLQADDFRAPPPGRCHQLTWSMSPCCTRAPALTSSRPSMAVLAPSRLQSFLEYPQLSLKPEVEWPEGFRESGNGKRKPGQSLETPIEKGTRGNP